MLWLEDNENQTFEGHWIWKLDIWPKITCFLWLCFHDSVPIKQVIAKREINCDPRCPLCKNEDESIAHMLKDCLFALNLWERIGVPQPLTSTFQLDLLEWLKRNYLCSNQFQINGIPWSTLFLFTVWELWKHRNGVALTTNPLILIFTTLASNLQQSTSVWESSKKENTSLSLGCIGRNHQWVGISWILMGYWLEIRERQGVEAWSVTLKGSG